MTDTSIITSGGFHVKTLDQIAEVAPAVVAKDNHPTVSEKYARISTVELIKDLEKFGWKPFTARQIGKGGHGRHVVRLTNEKSGIVKIKRDDIFAQMILDNSYDGTHQAEIDLGLFRLVCGNGMTVRIPNMTTSYSFRHMGVSEQAVKEIVEQAIENFNHISTHIELMQNTKLSDKQKTDLAVKALILRDSALYKDDEGKVNTKKVSALNRITELLEPLRDNDKGDELWKVFNVIQEKLVMGGYRRISANTGRLITVPGLANPVRNVTFNKELWLLAEGYLPS